LSPNAFPSTGGRLKPTISQASGEKFVSSTRVTHPHTVNRPDGVIHEIERFIIPESVQQDFNNHRSLWEISANKPEGAPKISVDGSMKFGQGEGLVYLLNPDIYTDERIFGAGD
jgi:hypothetical protein